MRLSRAGSVLLALALVGNAWAAPTPTPTPRPRLSGGFGRQREPAAPSPAGGQSLRDVVRAAGETRGKKPAPSGSAVTISNQTLVTDPQKGRITTSSRATAAPAQDSPSRTFTAGPPPGAAPSEAEWRAAAREARERVVTLKERIRQLEGEEAKLEADFYAWDDGQYRDNVIKPAWDRKREELESTRRELAEAEKDLADLPEKARKAGALPGWLRE